MAGMIGAVLFVSVFTVSGWLSPGYSPTRMFVSELSLGPHGWVQILNFVLTGALLLVFGLGLAAHFGIGAAFRAGPALIQGIGVSLMASGPFTTDPSAMFQQASIHGVVHGIFGALVFTFAPISCFVFYRRFRRDTLAPPGSVDTGQRCCSNCRSRPAQDQPAARERTVRVEGPRATRHPVHVHGLDLRSRIPPSPPIPQRGRHPASAAVKLRFRRRSGKGRNFPERQRRSARDRAARRRVRLPRPSTVPADPCSRR